MHANCTVVSRILNRVHRRGRSPWFLLLVAALLLASCATLRQRAGDGTAVVPDKAFRTFLLEQGYATKVSGHRLRPTVKGTSLTEMTCYEKGIRSMEGISMFHELTTLVCSGNPITHLNLNGLPMLESLYGIDMPLVQLDMDSCHNLTHIELRHTNLSQFDLRPFPALTYFFCIFSPLTRLDLSPCPSMRSVYIRGTQIEELDITPCRDIWQVHATDTPLRRVLITPQQWRADIILSCDNSVEVEVVPWYALKPLKSRAVMMQEAKSYGLTLDTLEHYYPSGMLLFGDSVPQEYMQSWMNFVAGLRNALLQAGMNWEEAYRLWGRAFFAADGSVDQYIYTWTGDLQPPDEWQTKFREVLEQYLATYRFAYPMHRNFAQCGGIRLVPNK